MKKYIIGGIIGATVLFLIIASWPSSKLGKGSGSSQFSQVATSGFMIVSSDAQILATSTRKYALICNDNASNKLYLSLDADKPVLATGVNTSVVIAVNSCYAINRDNLYTGAIRASSTISSVVYIVEATGY